MIERLDTITQKLNELQPGTRLKIEQFLCQCFVPDLYGQVTRNFIQSRGKKEEDLYQLTNSQHREIVQNVIQVANSNVFLAEYPKLLDSELYNPDSVKIVEAVNSLKAVEGMNIHRNSLVITIAGCVLSVIVFGKTPYNVGTAVGIFGTGATTVINKKNKIQKRSDVISSLVDGMITLGFAQKNFTDKEELLQHLVNKLKANSGLGNVVESLEVLNEEITNEKEFAAASQSSQFILRTVRQRIETKNALNDDTSIEAGDQEILDLITLYRETLEITGRINGWK
jgi:hypothetical protein